MGGVSLPATHEGITGLEQFDKVIDIDQSPIGRTPDPIRRPIQAFLPQSGNFSPEHLSPRPRLQGRALFVQRAWWAL